MKLKTILAFFLILALVGVVWAQTNKKNVQMNNQACPVTGNPVNDKDTYIYNGKEYRLCGEQCKQSLSENPEQYLSN
jgi:YHS domain-containing protein